MPKIDYCKVDVSSLDSSDSKINNDDAESMVCSLAQESHDDEDDQDANYRNKLKSKFRSKRKLSIAPLPSLRLNDKEMIANEFDNHSVISNQNSITSVSSLASLLKEKIQMFPAMMKKKRKTSDDFKIKAFVTILFLVIVFLIGYAYIHYHNQILARSYFNKVKFNEAKRLIRIYDSKSQEVITGRMGISLSDEEPYHCLRNENDGSVCLEWNERARLYLNLQVISQSTRCYTIKWESLCENFIPTDCYDVSEEKGHWYGGGLTRNADWPLEKASFDFAPFITGDTRVQQWGNVLRRYFINSRAVAITVDEKVPLHISMNHNNSSEFCFQAKNDNFAFVNRLTPFPVLSYKICTGDDMKSLHKQMTEQSLWDGIKETDVNVVHSLLEEPVWQIPTNEEMNETTIFNYTEKVIALSFLKLGHVLLNEFWQETIGDFSLDIDRFPTFESTVNMLHRRGFRISLTVQPFISTESANFGETVAKKLLIYERLSERSIPALTRYKSLASAGVLDVTNNDSIPWLLDQLQKVTETYEINSFFLDMGTAYNMPHYYQCIQSLENPDQYKTIFTSRLEGGLNIIGYNSIGDLYVPRPPAFLSLPPVNSSWDSLQTIVTSVLMYGVIGYPFIMSGPVGGDYLLPKNHSKMITFYSLKSPPLPDEELYIRWFQLATFLPVIRFTHLPSEYDTELVSEVSKELAMIRQNIVTPTLKKYLNDAMNDAIPLIRPLWLLDPLDVSCLSVNDEFSVGDEVIVAPILEKGLLQREVYLPQGVWKDGIDGSLRKGSRWIHNYKVPQNKVAFFVKMPDNTRF